MIRQAIHSKTTMGEWEFPPSEMDFEEIEIFPFEKEVERNCNISSETKIEESSILPRQNNLKNVI